SALLSGYPIGDPVVRESVLFMNEQGEILFADEPIFNAPEGDITLAGENILLSTEGRGNIISDSAIVAPVGSFQAGVAIGTTGAYITTSDNNLVFYDPETGAKTLAELALVGGSGGGTTVINES